MMVTTMVTITVTSMVPITVTSMVTFMVTPSPPHTSPDGFA